MKVTFSETVVSPDADDGDEIRIICPWLKGLSAETGPWLCALPIADVNAFMDDDGRFDVPADLDERTYFGVFALDRFRQAHRIFARLRAKGINRIINVPSVSFFDGQSAETFESLGFGWEEEVDFLRRAGAEGLRTAVCARRPITLGREDEALFDFVLAHEGPRCGFSIQRTHPGRSGATEGPGSPS